MAEKISITEIQDGSKYVNMAYNIQSYRDKFCGGSQTYNLPNVYLSNLLIYDLNKLKSTLSIGNPSSNHRDLNKLFLFPNTNNESFVNSSNINFYRYLNNKTNGFIDSLFYNTSIDCTRYNLPLYTSNTQNDTKLIKIDNNFKVVPFPFFYPRPIDCISIKINNNDSYTIRLHDSNRMSFNDPSLPLNSVYYSKSNEDYWRVLAPHNNLINLCEKTTYNRTKNLYNKIGFIKNYNIYYNHDEIYCNFYFYLLNDFLPDGSSYKNQGTTYQGPAIFYNYSQSEPGMKFQLIYEKKFILSHDDCVYITGNSLLSYVSSALGSKYTNIHVYFTEINEYSESSSSANFFGPGLGGGVGTIAKFLSINSASVRGSDIHIENDRRSNEYIHAMTPDDETFTYTPMFVVAVAQNTTSQKYQLILVGIFTLNNLVYHISKNTPISSLDTYPIKTLKPSEAIDIYKYPIINKDDYRYARGSFTNTQLYPISTDIGGCSYYYDDDSALPIPKVCKIERRNTTLSSVLWKYGSYVNSNNDDVNDYIFSCMTEINWYNFNFNAYEYLDSYGYSY